MKKDIQWLKEMVWEARGYAAVMTDDAGNISTAVTAVSVHEVIDLINQLDEPEVLSQEWIDEHVDYVDVRGGTQAFIYVEDLQNLLVPEQELPSIPQFVAEWYESEGKRSSWWNWFYKWGRDESRSDLETKTIKWMQDYNEEKFVDMFLNGYTVEEEQKYYVIFNTRVNQELDDFGLDGTTQENFNYLAIDASGNTWVEDTRTDDLSWEERSDFTEDKIKEVDPRYWPFAVKVEELNE